MRHSSHSWAQKTCAKIIKKPDQTTKPLTGRNLWTFHQLQRAGQTGITAAQFPGARLAAYICKLRERGIDIETIYEPSNGPFSGTHARYVLRSNMRVEENSGGQS